MALECFLLVEEDLPGTGDCLLLVEVDLLGTGDYPLLGTEDYLLQAEADHQGEVDSLGMDLAD